MKHKYGINVLYIITKLELGGAQKVCLSLIKGLEQEGHNPLLITGKEGYFVDQLKNAPNVLFIDTFKREVSIKYIFKEFINFLKIIKRIRNIKKVNDHLIVHTHSTKAGIIGRWAAFFCGVKTRIHTVHGFAFHPNQSFLKWVIIYLIELLTSFITTHYVCVSSEDVKTGSKLFPRFSKKHSIIRAAVDSEKFIGAISAVHGDSSTSLRTKGELLARRSFNVGFEPYERPLSCVFGTIACFKEQKNLFDLLKAFHKVSLENPDTSLEIIGDGILRPQIESFIKEHKLTQKITLHGWQQEVMPIMQNWDAFVLTSLWEGLPCAVIEARMLKIPVLSYKTGGIPDVISDQQNGLLYDQKDWPSLAAGMLKISKNSDFQKNLANFHDNLSDFDNLKMVYDHIKLYKEIE
ncbi:hypothetical protein A3F66_02625 [candidate division TM6 bacterium RIFCSPHIGHO2_12_FULL_32_22]|nr:MAG: hypothetical protein A3F66_02625 [candidate division TM6 bacterium RIFCSPHIGHO2_12_FULL_32_22]